MTTIDNISRRNLPTMTANATEDLTYPPGAYDYLAVERVVWGAPAADSIVAEAERRGAKRLFLVTSKTLKASTPAINNIEAALGNRIVGTFVGCVEHTPIETVLEAAAAIQGSRADLVVTVGGGTHIDTVKAALIALAEDVRDVDGFRALKASADADGTRVVPPIKDPPLRQIVVPTTLTGADFSDLAGVTDTENRTKYLYTQPKIGGAAVLLDPALTVHTPEWLWLSTGIRAVDHAVETICGRTPQPLADAGALHALRLLAAGLLETKRAPDDLAARQSCQLGVWMSCMGLNRVQYGASHGIGHLLGAVSGVPHGYTSCVMLPHVMRYNRAGTETRQSWIADALGRPGEDAADAVAGLVAGLGLPGRLRDVDVSKDDFAAIAEGSLGTIFVRNNARPITDASQIVELLETAW